MTTLNDILPIDMREKLPFYWIGLAVFLLVFFTSQLLLSRNEDWDWLASFIAATFYAFAVPVIQYKYISRSRNVAFLLTLFLFLCLAALPFVSSLYQYWTEW